MKILTDTQKIIYLKTCDCKMITDGKNSSNFLRPNYKIVLFQPLNYNHILCISLKSQ